MAKKTDNRKRDSDAPVLRTQRFWEVDAARGSAIILMVWYHLLFVLSYLRFWDGNIRTLSWLIVARTASTAFLVLVGVSLVLSWQRAQVRGESLVQFRRHTLGRGLQIFGWGVVMTVGTALLDPRFTIWFGILHFIGTSVILATPFVRYPRRALLTAIALFGLGWPLVQSFYAENWWLLWIGVPPPSFRSFDYWPLVPWLGLVLVGVALGNWLYTHYQRRLSLPKKPPLVLGWLAVLGKWSLTIYLLHIPVILVGLWLLGLTG